MYVHLSKNAIDAFHKILCVFFYIECSFNV